MWSVNLVNVHTLSPFIVFLLTQQSLVFCNLSWKVKINNLCYDRAFMQEFLLSVSSSVLKLIVVVSIL